MDFLLAPLRGRRRSSLRAKVLILGTDGTGCAVHGLLPRDARRPSMDEDFLAHDRSANIRTHTAHNRSIHLEIMTSFDTGAFTSMRASFNLLSDVFIIMYNITDSDSWEDAKKLYNSVVRDKEGDGFPAVIVGHHPVPEDEGLDESMHSASAPPSRAVPVEKVYGWCQSRLLPYVECCTKTLENVQQLFDIVAEEYLHFFQRSRAARRTSRCLSLPFLSPTPPTPRRPHCLVMHKASQPSAPNRSRGPPMHVIKDTEIRADSGYRSGASSV